MIRILHPEFQGFSRYGFGPGQAAMKGSNKDFPACRENGFTIFLRTITQKEIRPFFFQGFSNKKLYRSGLIFRNLGPDS